jgi:hypothetical protein
MPVVVQKYLHPEFGQPDGVDRPAMAWIYTRIIIIPLSPSPLKRPSSLPLVVPHISAFSLADITVDVMFK